MTQGDEGVGEQEAVVEAKVKRLRPSECRSHMRKALAKDFQEIVDGFVAAAKLGSCPHVKLATELLKPIRKSPSRKKGTATRYWEMLEREAPERDRLRQAAEAGLAK